MMKFALALVLALSIAGCAAAPSPFAGADPADPAALVPQQQYRSALATYASRRPVEPSGWPGTNEKIAPQPRTTP
jgi:hypothetical protein